MNLSLPLAACPLLLVSAGDPEEQTAFSDHVPGYQFCTVVSSKPFPEASGSLETQQLLLGDNSTSQTSARLCSFSRCYEPNIAKNARDPHGLFPLQRFNRVETRACWQQVWLNERKCSPRILQSWHPSAFPAEGAGFRSLGRMAGLLL